MTAPLIEAREVRKYYHVAEGPFSKRGVLKAVDGVSLELAEGETLGIVGESGCGKSTLGRLLMNLIPLDGGEFLYRGRHVEHLDRKELFAFRREVQMIFQDPYASLNPRMHVGDIIAEPLKIHGLAGPDGYRRTVLDLMEKVGLREDHYRRYPHEFSGGQRQRVGIARALAVHPKVIIADEPVSALDLSIQAQIVNLLQDLQREFSLSYIFIAHDLSVVRHISSRIAIMYLGRIVETGNRDDVFLRPLHPYTEALISAIPQTDPKARRKRIVLQGDLPTPLDPPGGCPFHTRCPYARDLCVRERPPLEEKEPGHRAACHFSSEIFGDR